MCLANMTPRAAEGRPGGKVKARQPALGLIIHPQDILLPRNGVA
jgi:hypothetical protein